MYRSAIRGQHSQWHSTSGYVCRSCREHLAQQHRSAIATQRRHENTRAETTSTAQLLTSLGTDSWEENFNSLSVDESSKKSAPIEDSSHRLGAQQDASQSGSSPSQHQRASLRRGKAGTNMVPDLAHTQGVEDLLNKLKGVSAKARASTPLQGTALYRRMTSTPLSAKQSPVETEVVINHGAGTSSGGEYLVGKIHDSHSDAGKGSDKLQGRKDFEHTMAQMSSDNVSPTKSASSSSDAAKQANASPKRRRLPPNVVDEVVVPEAGLPAATDSIGSQIISEYERIEGTRRENPFQSRSKDYADILRHPVSPAPPPSFEKTESQVPAYVRMRPPMSTEAIAPPVKHTKTGSGWGGRSASPIVKEALDDNWSVVHEVSHADERKAVLVDGIVEEESIFTGPSFAISPGDLAEEGAVATSAVSSNLFPPKQHSSRQRSKPVASTLGAIVKQLKSRSSNDSSAARSEIRRPRPGPKGTFISDSNIMTAGTVTEPSSDGLASGKIPHGEEGEGGAVHSVPLHAKNIPSLPNPGDSPHQTSINVRYHGSGSASSMIRYHNAGSREDHASLEGSLAVSPDHEKSISHSVQETRVAREQRLPSPSSGEAGVSQPDIGSIKPDELDVIPLHIPQPSVPSLQYGLDRVLFNQGLYQLQDPRSRVYNFDPYLEKVMPISEFDFNALKVYKTSSQDEVLSNLAKEHGKRYVGSTSSMTGVLGQFHYLLSNWRELNLDMLSKGFAEKNAMFTQLNRAPSAVFLRWKNGTYAVDGDKEFDGANVLMMLGKSMEKVLTLPREEYERYRRDNTTNPITDNEKEQPEAFEYTTHGDFLMRSQLDAYDPRLPGTGMFDLKTRAVLPIRMDTEDYEELIGYELMTPQGTWESYEREYYDMMRSTMLKYSLQARMGRMDGIFVAYHNIERIFGFQYITLSEMDRALHGQVSTYLGDMEFKASLKLLNDVFNMATEAMPNTTLRIHFEAVPAPANMMWVFAEPVSEEEADEIQGRSKKRVEGFEAKVMGLSHESEMKVESASDKDWVAEAAAENIRTTASMDVDNASEASVNVATDGDSTATTEALTPVTSPSDYDSSTGPADPQFYEHITPTVGSEGLKPLFAATILVQNFVNGEACEGNRAVNLKPTDKWEIKYILKEAPLETAQKWARYEDCKARRRKALWWPEDEGDSGDGEEAITIKAKPVAESKEEGQYRNFLRSMVEHGKEYRRMLDKLDEGREKVVVGVPDKVSGE